MAILGAQFAAQLFNISASGANGAKGAIASFIESLQGTYGFFAAAPTVNINENLFMFVILTKSAATITKTTGLGVTGVEQTYAMDDGGVAAMAAMEANYIGGGSPTTALTIVRAVELNKLNNVPMLTVVQSA